MIAQAIVPARAAGMDGEILLRGDSAFGSRAVVGARRRHGARFSLVLNKNPAGQAAIASIPDDAWTPVKYPGAVRDPDTGEWISDAEVAEASYTAFAATKDRITARLIVRRVRDARVNGAGGQDALFPVWRHHPFFTDSTEPTRRTQRRTIRRPPVGAARRRELEPAGGLPGPLRNPSPTTAGALPGRPQVVTVAAADVENRSPARACRAARFQPSR
jgi:hypothetical protein